MGSIRGESGNLGQSVIIWVSACRNHTFGSGTRGDMISQNIDWCLRCFPRHSPFTQRLSDQVLTRALAHIRLPVHLSADGHFDLHHVVHMHSSNSQRDQVSGNLRVCPQYLSSSTNQAPKDLHIPNNQQMKDNPIG